MTMLIKLEQANARLTGFAIGGGCRYLRHLLYADDCLLVVRASVEEAGTVNELLKEYCTMNGQKVNFSKSQVIFRADVPT